VSAMSVNVELNAGAGAEELRRVCEVNWSLSKTMRV
jgi:hypothetical protein